MAAKVGTLIKQARQNAGLTQAELAKKVDGGVTASDIGKAERGEATLTNAALKKIALATGVTQASLLNASKPGKPTASTASATPASAGLTMRVTATEKKLIGYYRAAGTDARKAATNVLQGKCDELVPSLLSTSATGTGKTGDVVADLLGNALGSLLGNK
ncbi:MAG: helix-turn-helix transcriptional regulator [Candidatus Limiplasma sp.]|nr:helix-turn-helix transcriptional regulator [Candidatus Limiplasma sp.]